MADHKVVVGWFERNDYPHVLDVMEDGHHLPKSFDEWEKHTKAGEDMLEAKGRSVIRTTIKPDAFVSWAHEHGFRADAAARVRLR